MPAFAHTLSYRAGNGVFGKSIFEMCLTLKFLESDIALCQNVKSAEAEISKFFWKKLVFWLEV